MHRKTTSTAVLIVLAGFLCACAGETREQSPEGAMSDTEAGQQPGARFQPGTELGIYTPEQHLSTTGASSSPAAGSIRSAR